MKNTKILFALLLLFSMLMLSSCGIRTAKYDFELEGDIILKEGYRGESLSAFVYCTTTCVSGRDYFQNPSGLYYTSAELIAPDGTIYKFNPPVPPAVTQVNVKRGDVFKEHIFFEELPLELAPGKYDLRVWNTTSGRSEKLFEDVTVRFDEEAPAETMPAVQLPPLSESLASEADVKGVGVEMDGVIVEAKRYSYISYQCCGYDETTGEYYYSSWGENFLPGRYDTQKLIDEGCPIVKYSSNYQMIDNIENNSSSGVSLWGVFNSDFDNGVYQSVPSDPGLYWMMFTVSYNNHPMMNKEVTPVLNEWYSVEDQYWVGVIVE